MERDAGRRGVYYSRARTLGGCTAHYAMIIMRPHDSDWQAIEEATGYKTWTPRKMDEYFARVERWHINATPAAGHGTKGWLPTRFADPVALARDAIHQRDPSIGEIVIDALRSNPGHLPIHWWDRRFFLDEGKLKAKWDPNDLRMLKRHGVGVIAIPMAISYSFRG